jgi:hypothetical protein
VPLDIEETRSGAVGDPLGTGGPKGGMVRRPFRVWECRNVGIVAHIFTASSPKSRLDIISKPVWKPKCNKTLASFHVLVICTGLRPLARDSEPDLRVLLLLTSLFLVNLAISVS